MNRSVSAQISYDRLNKGVDIRNPSTAAFLIDSADKSPANSASDFIITPKGQNLFTGFFTRFALTEMTLTWGVCNISEQTGLTSFQFRYSAVTYTATLLRGFYTVKECLDAMVTAMNTAVGSAVFSITDSASFKGVKAITGTSPYFFLPNADPTVAGLANQLGIPTRTILAGFTSVASYNVVSPDLRPYNYIDFTSPQLSAQQDVKDASTAQGAQPDSIYRWVFANTSFPIAEDEYGYPILQGYKAFSERRYLAFPKQIRWDPLSPLGQVQFQVLDSTGAPVQYGYQDFNSIALPNSATNPYGQRFEFQMLMLVSEV
jgi:hypothetical protein